MSKFKKYLVFLLTLLIFFVCINNVSAQDNLTPTLTVDRVASNFEKLGEKITLIFKFGPKNKSDYHQYLVEKRLAELYYSVKTDQIDLVEPTASRYNTYLGRLNEYIMANSLKDKKGEIKNLYDKHSKIIEELQKKYKWDSAWWLSLQHAINNLKDFSTKINSL